MNSGRDYSHSTSIVIERGGKTLTFEVRRVNRLSDQEFNARRWEKPVRFARGPQDAGVRFAPLGAGEYPRRWMREVTPCTCLALLSIDTDPALRPIATVYDASEAAVAGQDHRVKLRSGRLVALGTLTGEAENIAGRMYDDAMGQPIAHPCSEPLETTEHGRAFIAAWIGYTST